jgi:hypothetical protein
MSCEEGAVATVIGRRGGGVVLGVTAVGVLVIALQVVGRAPAAAAGRTSRPADGQGASASPVHSPALTSRPTASVRPRVTVTPTPAPFVDGDGFWVDGTSSFHKVNSVYQTGNCLVDLCPDLVQVLSAPVATGIGISSAAGGEHRVAGATIGELTRALAAAFPKAITEDIRIDGLPSVRLTDDSLNAAWALTLVGARIYAFRAPDFFAPVGWTNLRTFTWDLHFLARACWMTPCPKGVEPAPGEVLLAFDAARLGTSWDERPPSLRRDPQDDHSMREFQWSCDAGCAGWLRVSIGTTATGPLVAPDGRTAIRLPGSDLDSLRAAWQAASPDASFTPTKVGPEPAVTAWDARRGGTLFFIHRGYVIAITAEGTLRWDPAAGYMLDEYASALTLQP